jgi:O-6-methylguanine DNA methyltransferase
MYYTFHDTPAGGMLLVADDMVITGLHWIVFKRVPNVDPAWTENKARFVELIGQLDDYFAGTRQVFDIAYRFAGTDFQKRVWHELEKIPHGASSSYGTIAAAIGRPNAVRAVGTAVGSNPISIIVPCHRVLTSTGGIGGYAGGVVGKQLLLRTEGISLRHSVPPQD